MTDFDRIPLRDKILLSLTSLNSATAGEIYEWLSKRTINLKTTKPHTLNGIENELKKMRGLYKKEKVKLLRWGGRIPRVYRLGEYTVSTSLSARLILALEEEYYNDRNDRQLTLEMAKEVIGYEYNRYLNSKDQIMRDQRFALSTKTTETEKKKYSDKLDHIMNGRYFTDMNGFLIPQERLIVLEKSYIKALLNPLPEPLYGSE